jgi:hypothetical protein
MQTIVKDGVSLYLFADNATLSISDENIITPDFVVSDCNSANSVVQQGVTAPDDWVGGKYCFDGSSWTINPLWVDPNAEKRKEQEAARRAAYLAEADPLFFMSQRGEATVEEWQAKVAEIKARYPHPEETQA